MKIKNKNENPRPAKQEKFAEVFCANSEIRKLDAIIEHPRNPNKHPAEQLRLLAKIIQSTGWRSPIVISKRSGFVIKGHGRFQAAQLAGLTEAPVDLQDYESEAAEWADMIADNQLAELADMSRDELRALAIDLEKSGADTELTGFTEADFAALVTPEKTNLIPVEIKPPPKMAWALIGIPLVRWGEIAPEIETIANLPEVFCETTYNDG